MRDRYSIAEALAILGLTSDATPAAVRRAFRTRALQHHPDRNPGDPAAPERFRAVSDAYNVLLARGTHVEPEPDPFEIFRRPPQPEIHHPGASSRRPLHYPTPEEIRNLDKPRTFEPLKWLTWLCVTLLVGTIALSLFAEHNHISFSEPAGSWVPRFLRATSRPPHALH